MLANNGVRMMRSAHRCISRRPLCRHLSAKSIDDFRASLAHCMKQVEQHDRENYAATLLAPPKARPAIYTIRALNVELAQIADTVSEPHIGEIKMQWWRNAIEYAAQGQPAQQPIPQMLAAIFCGKGSKVSPRWLLRMLDARAAALQPFAEQSKDMTAMETYGEATASSLLYTSLQAAGIESVHADHAASHIGKAQAMVTLLRAIPHNAHAEKFNLPLDLVNKHSVTPLEVFQEGNTRELSEAVFDMACTAKAHLDHARDLTKDLPQDAKNVLLPCVPAEIYLEKLQAFDFDVFHPDLLNEQRWGPLQLRWKLWKRSNFDA